jgi:hypothetical protein
VNPVEAAVVNSDFIAEDVAAFVTIAHGSRIFPVQIQNRTLFRAIRNGHFITLQRSFVLCTIFQSFLSLATSCNFHLPLSRYSLPWCCFFPRNPCIVRLTHSWAVNSAAPSIPLQLLLFRAKQYDLTAIHSFPTNLLSLLCTTRQIFYKKLEKTAPLNVGLCHTFLENGYV